MSKEHPAANLVLGTAQLCDPQSAPDARDASKLLIHAALNAGVKWIETSPSYPHAEVKIGQALRSIGKRAHVITRLRPSTNVPLGSVRDFVTDEVARACARLSVDRLDVLILDSVLDLKAHGGLLWRVLKELRDDGTVYDLGVAVTSPEEAMIAIADPAITYIQLQFNALDWRWREAGVIDALEQRPEILVHAHSALMYGMLAGTPSAKLPVNNTMDSEALRLTLWTMAKDMNRDCPADLCIAYVRAQPWIHGVIAGSRTTAQLALNLSRFKRPPLTKAEIERVNALLPRVSQTELTGRSAARAA